MEFARVVAVGGSGPVGSGYVVAPRLVLTSAHVVGEVGTGLAVFRPGREGGFGSATVVWRGTPGGRDDAALVHVTDERWIPPDDDRGSRWGRTVTYRPGIPCAAWGVPDLVQRSNRPTDLLQPSGTINPGDRVVGDRYVMSLHGHPPERRADGSSPWGGLSGAALFCGDLLAGVIVEDPAGRGHAHLEAVPVYVLLRDEGFRTVLAGHTGAGPVLEPIEFQGLGQAPEPAAFSSPAGLLRARSGVVPFRGRTDLLARLHSWCDQPGFAVRLVHGPGGQGKTRLACRLSADLEARGWTVLWPDPRVPADELRAVRDATSSLLVVLDYAETRAGQLDAVLDAAVRRHRATPMKVLLLARSAGSWWQIARESSAAASSLLASAPVDVLEPLAPDDAGRADAYREAVTAFAAALPRMRGREHHPWSDLAAALPAPALRGVTLEIVLTLHMTALANLLDAADSPSTVDEEAALVEDRLLEHERRYWTTTAQARGLYPALTMRTLTEAMAATTLLGARDYGEAESLLLCVPGLADQSHDRRTNTLGWIATLYPPASRGAPFDTLQPDRLAERFVGRLLADDHMLADHLAPAASESQAIGLLTLWARAAAHVVFADDPALRDALTELCVRHASTLAVPAIHVATIVNAPEPLLAALVRIGDAEHIDRNDLAVLVERLPRRSHRLAEWAVRLTGRLLEYDRVLAADNPALWPVLVAALNNHSSRLAGFGRRDEALALATEAIDLLWNMTDDGLSEHGLLLASVLHNLSVHLRAAGRWQESVEASDKSVGVHRELARLAPGEYRHSLAVSLTVHSDQLAAVGQLDEALQCASEALEIQRELAGHDPDQYLPWVAASLTTFAHRLCSIGMRYESTWYTSEAVEIYRELARHRPDEFEGTFADTLNDYAADVGLACEPDEALEVSIEAVETHRELSRIRPDRFLPGLAASLFNHASRLSDAGHELQALEVNDEAACLLRELGHYPATLADGLTNRSQHLAKLGRLEEALAVNTEALALYRGLEVAAIPADRVTGLASCLTKRSLLLATLERWQEALAASEEDVLVRRDLPGGEGELDKSLAIRNHLRRIVQDLS